MAEQRMKVRDKKVQKMTKDGLVEENLTDKSSVRVSNRASDVQMGGKQGEKEVSLVDKSSRQSERSGKNIRPSVQKSRDAPELIRAEKQSEDLGQSRKQQNRKRIRAEVGKESRLAEKSEAGQSGRLKEKRADLSENRGDSRRNQTGGSKKPKQKQRLKFAYEETGASVKNDKDMEKLNQMDTDGVNFRHQKQKEKAKKFSYEEAKKKKEAKQHSKKAQVYQANDGEAPGKKKSRLKFGEGESVKTEKTSVVKKAGSAASAALHREISKNEDDNAAVEGDKIDATAISKGKGFQGAIKRFGQHRGPMAHGSKFHRHQGSNGACSSPSKVFKGKGMPGHMGSVKVTVQNLEVVRVDAENNLLLVKGSVPGPKKSLVTIKETVKA